MGIKKYILWCAQNFKKIITMSHPDVTSRRHIPMEQPMAHPILHPDVNPIKSPSQIPLSRPEVIFRWKILSNTMAFPAPIRLTTSELWPPTKVGPIAKLFVASNQGR
jgi:hypothetical protein